MANLANLLDGINRTVGKTVAWLLLLMVLVQFAVVLMRYVYGVGDIRAQESIIYMHGFIFMLAAAYTLSADGHVRVDIFYRGANPRFKAKVNLFGSIFLLIPVALTIIIVSWTYVGNSWRILEGSMERSGIQGVFLLKTAIPVFGAMLVMQGVVMVLRSLLALRGDETELKRLAHA